MTAKAETQTYRIGDVVGYVPLEDPIDLTPDPEASHFWLQTEPGREMTAQANLLLRKIPFYLPTILRPARLPMRKHLTGADHPDIMAPLFPRAIFISMAVMAAKEWAIRTTPGMQANPFVMFGANFAALRPVHMQAIQYIEAGERELYYRARNRKNVPAYIPNVGDDVRFLVSEALGRHGGRVTDVDEQGRITLLIELMKRTVRVRTTADRIEPV